MTGPRRILGLILGLGGAALMGWGLFNAVTAPCLESPAYVAAYQTCSSNPPMWVAGAMAGGIVLAVIGMLLGGGAIVFSALFVAIGLSTLIPTWLGLMPDMALFGWLFGGSFLFFGLLPLLGGLLLGRLGAHKRLAAAQLMAGGVKAVGTIVEVRDTGMTINDNPRVTVRMRVAPLDGSPPVERSKTITVSRLAIPRAGDRFPVWFDRADPDKWMWGTDMDKSAAPAAVREMFARAAAGDGDADGNGDGPVEELARLSQLWKDGALTDREFAEAKARLLPRIGR